MAKDSDSRIAEAPPAPAASHFSTAEPYRGLVESSADMMALLGADASILYANPAMARELGIPGQPLASQGLFELMHPDDQERTREVFEALLAKPGTKAFASCRLRAKDGTWCCIELSGTNLFEDPKVRAIAVSAQDITVRKRAEIERRVIFEIIHALNVTANLDELLAQIHKALRKVLDAENCFVALYDHASEMFHFPFFVDRFDPPPPPVKAGRGCTAYVFRTGKPMLIRDAEFSRLVAAGEVELVGTPSPAWLGVPLRTPSATIGVLVVQDYERPDAYNDRDLELLTSVGGQIALAIDRKRAEDALRKQQEEQQIIFHAAPSMIWFKDAQNRILRANRAAAESLGMTVSQVEGKAAAELFCDSGSNYHHDLEVVRTGAPKLGIVESYRAVDGNLRQVRTDKIPYHDQEGNIIGAIVFATDITDQQRAEEALRRSEANYRSLVKGAPYGICRVSEDGGLFDVNPSLVEMLGYSSEAELLAVNLRRQVFHDPAEFAQMTQQPGERIVGVEAEWNRKDGSHLTVRLSGRLVRDPDQPQASFEIVVENVTEQRALETQLRQAVKMEAIGRLAGGVAHDFNNLLMVIKGHTELLAERVKDSESNVRKVELIQKAADRAAGLTRQLLAFSRMQVLQPRVMDLNSVVLDMGKLLPRLIGEDIELAIRTRPGTCRIKADPGQIEQVIMNLAVNSRDAMPNGGRLVIETGEIELDDAFSRRHPPLIPGHYVLLVVTDTGMGMDAETQAHVFEPFFTTKEHGKGTGLGLATVYGVVKQSGGYIWLYSECGRGASFKIYLPRVEEPLESPRPATNPGEMPRGSETILLAEDEKDVREVAREFLLLSGYTVLEAKDGDEALEIASRHPGEIHLLISDMVMPGMTGRDLATRIHQIRPGLKVLFMSGYTEYAALRNGDLGGKEFLLTKPFTRGVLTNVVREVLQCVKV